LSFCLVPTTLQTSAFVGRKPGPRRRGGNSATVPHRPSPFLDCLLDAASCATSSCATVASLPFVSVSPALSRCQCNPLSRGSFTLHLSRLSFSIHVCPLLPPRRSSSVDCHRLQSHIHLRFVLVRSWHEENLRGIGHSIRSDGINVPRL
jgi:hypothetical protein